MEHEDVDNRRHQVEVYLRHARQALDSAASSLEHGFHTTATDRAYYAVFYATSGLLLSKGISRSRHTGVIAAFREHFVKPGLVEAEYSDLYGAVMESRISGDYELASETNSSTSAKAVDSARRFVERVSAYLLKTEGIRT